MSVVTISTHEWIYLRSVSNGPWLTMRACVTCYKIWMWLRPSIDGQHSSRPGHSGHRGPRLPVPAQHTSWHWQLSSAYIAIIRFRWSITCGRRIHGLGREIDGLPPAAGPAPAGWPFLALLADQYQHHAVTVTTAHQRFRDPPPACRD
jgi:hypothetical protein